ncbi:MAG: 23S rRNA (guanosine(2251)-2'-O)-methyltransferase RlmB [Steroidobacteraceae bacterium]
MAGIEKIYGLHAVGAFLARDPERVQRLWLQAGRRDGRIADVEKLARAAGIAIAAGNPAELDRMVEGAVHQGVVAEVRAREPLGEDELPFLLEKVSGLPLVLLLDGVQDPHNLGACLRTADAAGVHAVVVPRDRASGLTPVARKVAAGAAESVPFVQVTNLSRTMKALKEQGLWIIGTEEEAACELYGADLNLPLAVVMGAEGRGMRRLTRDHCDFTVRLPMRGAVESLNVSVATGVVLYEALRQRTAGR